MATSMRDRMIRSATWSLGISILVGVLLSLRDLTPERFALNAGISLLYSLSIGIPATVVFGLLKGRMGGSALRQWGIYAGVMVALVAVASLVVGVVLVVLGLANGSELWRLYWRGLAISGTISIPATISAVAVSRLQDNVDGAEREKQRAQVVATEARMASLESRVRPHFLFNALNSAMALIPAEPRRAEDVLERLSALLRVSLDAQARVAIGEELRVVTDYLEIEKVRFGERLRYHVDVADDVHAIEVPSFAIQTLVENSVKYAVSPRKEGARIEIRASRQQDQVTIEVVDDGPGFGDAIGLPGHGLDALRSRLDVLYGSRARLIAPHETARGASVRIEIEAA